MIMHICLYGSSSDAINRYFIDEVERLGEALARAGHDMVYGAGGAGLMGAAARGMTRANGYIIGVVPRFLNVDGVIYDKCDDLILTETMRERKQVMEDHADAFVITPGGIGTYEEFFEMYTLKQLGRHCKPLVIYNIGGYYNSMLRMIRDTVDRGFMKEKSLSLFTVANNIPEVLEQITMPLPEPAVLSEMKHITK